MSKSIISLFIFIIILLGMGSIIGQVTQVNIPNWYVVLNKSSLTPPNIVFPIVWTCLYLMLAYVGWRIFQLKEVCLQKTLFVLGMFMNWAWSFLFFEFHYLGLSFVWLIIMIMILLYLICLTWRSLKFSSQLLMIYGLWLIFASYLNLFIWLNN